MKVLLIQPKAREFDSHLAKGLGAAGMTAVFAYTTSEPRSGKRGLLGAEALYLPLRSRFDLKGMLGVRKLILETAPKVIYCGTAIQSFTAILAQMPRKRAKLIFYRGAIRRFNWFSPSDILIFKSGWVDIFHCASNAVANSVRQIGNFDNKIVTFPSFGYAASEFDSVEPAASVAKGAARFRIGAVANYRRCKGLEYAVDALTHLVDQGVDAELYFVGEDRRGELAKYIANSPVKSRIVQTGPIPSPWGVMKTFDCLVVPSLSEGHGKVIVEAFGCGVPVVATNVGGIPELIKHGANGLLVQPQNAAQLADAIRNVLVEENLSAQLKLNGKKVFREKFEISVAVSNYIDMFRKVVTAG